MVGLQSASGAFVASPDFSQYQYCWLRDSSFVAYALDLAAEHESAARFHAWVERALGQNGIGPQLDAAVERRSSGGQLAPGDLPPARFSLSGEALPDDWPNFQIDGYGIWLWALREHLNLTGDGSLPRQYRDTVERTARYLAAFAFQPCFDVWEENGQEVHTSTLACVYAGLVAASEMLGDEGLKLRADDVKERLTGDAALAGRYVKSSAQNDVDASVLWLVKPFGVVAADDPTFLRTVDDVVGLLTMGGGIRRYPNDSYFGGGAWPVLTSSLGWYYAAAGRPDEARSCLEWSRQHFDDEGRLGEQFGGETRNPVLYREWVNRWGPPAGDLLWSHAMYVILGSELNRPAHS